MSERRANSQPDFWADMPDLTSEPDSDSEIGEADWDSESDVDYAEPDTDHAETSDDGEETEPEGKEITPVDDASDDDEHARLRLRRRRRRSHQRQLTTSSGWFGFQYRRRTGLRGQSPQGG